MGARNIFSFKNIAGNCINKFQENTIGILDGNVIQLFKVTTLQLKKHQSYIKIGHSRQIFYQKSTG